MKLLKNKYGWFVILSLFGGYLSYSQDTATDTSETKEEKPVAELVLNMKYFQPDNKIPYLLVSINTKLERKFTPQTGMTGTVYLNDTSTNSSLGKIKTDSKGEGRVYIPEAFKTIWDSSANFNFIAVTDPTTAFESQIFELPVTKAKIAIDTSSDVETRNITVTVMELKDGAWIPAKDVELKIAIKRLLGNLPAGDEETYTTDSTGTVMAEFTRDSLPGNDKGELILEARTEDNENYGNLFAEQMVPWGIVQKHNDTFNDRSLWGNRFKTPIWLLALANSIILGVWGVLVYLIFLFFRIRKAGQSGKKNKISGTALLFGK